MSNTNFALISAAIAIIGVTLAGAIMISRPSKTSATIWVSHAPYSADPLDYDQFIHHVAFTPVFASLVTQYHAGEFKGIIASSWRSTDDARGWSFKIRTGLTYENGDPITADIVRQSLARMAFLQKSRNSASGFSELLVGLDDLHHATDKFSGITVEADSVHLNFSVPMPNLLKQLSFGLYSIAHPSNFDPNTGKWHSATKAIASGAYRISKWSEQEFQLELRPEFPSDLRHPEAIPTYVFTTDRKRRFESDLVFGANLEKEFGNSFEFFGPNAANIAYISCHSWSYGFGPCQHKESRQFYRWKFYKELERRGIKYSLSFFPLGMRDVKESSLPETSPNLPTTNGETKLAAIYKSNLPFSIIPPVIDALDSSYRAAGLNPVVRSVPAESIDIDGAPSDPQHYLDAIVSVTGVLVEDPDADIRFMKNSKEGIRLPDPTGKLKHIASSPRFSPQEVNEQLWEDAIVWPLFHFSLGLWAKKDEFDLTQVNISLPPTDVSWIGSK